MTNHHICVAQRLYRRFCSDYSPMHRYVAIHIAHYAVAMGAAVRRLSFVRVEMVAVTEATKRLVVFVVSIKQLLYRILNFTFFFW